LTPILRHIKTNTLYRHIENDRYRNLSTGVEGEVPPEIAQKIFAISLDATVLLNEFPNIEKLIKGLNLKILLPTTQ
jgi:hypothetical protein